MPLLTYEDLELLCKRQTAMIDKLDELQDQAARDSAAAMRKAVSYIDLLKGELDKSHTVNATLKARIADLEGEISRMKSGESTRVLPI